MVFTHTLQQLYSLKKFNAVRSFAIIKIHPPSLPLDTIDGDHPPYTVVGQTMTYFTVHILVDVEGRQDLPVVRHQGFTHEVCRHHQMLQHLQRGADNFWVFGVQRI